MLTGSVFFYAADGSGKRFNFFDRNVNPDYARIASGRYVARWQCENGDPRDVRYYHRGQQIPGERAARLLGWTGDAQARPVGKEV